MRFLVLRDRFGMFVFMAVDWHARNMKRKGKTLAKGRLQARRAEIWENVVVVDEQTK